MFAGVLAAAKRLDGVAHRTPVITSRFLNERTGNTIYLKCENFQRAGAFKFRGAYNAISSLTAEARERGVITHSSGNHAQALALAGRLLGVAVTVVMPKDAPAVKRAATEGYGATVVPVDQAANSREQVCDELIAAHGYTLIHPSDQVEIVAGQGTAAKELIEDVGDLDYVFAPCGGGGLLSGTAVAAKHLRPGCKVIGSEPANADDATRSFKTGILQTIHNPQTVADGLKTSLGKVTFPLVRQYVDDMLTVTEEEIISTMYYLWTRLKIVVEPSGAVALAPLFHRNLPIEGERVGVILSGGNVDVRRAGELFEGLDD
ncbi:MAG: threo-3-hydroxy-L-aspartate ammonia-lyase [Firmicutes bacterium]|nr:threo-3-hydroxy-L-aspartate ammonia-lyase [Bacillota bacterium]